MIVPPASGDAFNLVAVGAWNTAIFSPEWAKTHLSEMPDRDVILAIPMQMSLPPRLTVDDVNFFPSVQSLALDCVAYGEAGIKDCVHKFNRLADLLPHTPVSAIGINFRYWGDLNESEVLADLFAFSDAGKIDAGTYDLAGASLRRTYSLKDATYLNLSIDSMPDQLRLEFNFHAEVRTLSEAATKVTIERVQALRLSAEQFLSTVYGIELDS